MLHFLPHWMRGGLAWPLMVANTIFWCTPFYVVVILKFVIPLKFWRTFLSKVLIGIANCWIYSNGLISDLLNDIEYDVQGLEDVDPHSWYLVISNHRSWADILVLQRVLLHKVPFLKFFLKQELIKVPVLGGAWWALDFPFMKRYSKEHLEKHPEDKGKDLETTRKACEKFSEIPTSVMNFLEGTRFTVEKHDKQNSPFRHLLKPKSAGIAFVLAAMRDQLRWILDVTIAYEGTDRSLWGFFSGRIDKVMVRIRKIPITADLQGDYFNDDDFRHRFQEWTNQLWEEKDRILDELKGPELAAETTG